MIKLGREYQSVYVEQCIAQDRLKAAFIAVRCVVRSCTHDGQIRPSPSAKTAFIAVRTFGLEDEFPNVEGLYRQKTVTRLLGKRLWAVASKVVGSDVALQKMLLKQVGGHAALGWNIGSRGLGEPLDCWVHSFAGPS